MVQPFVDLEENKIEIDAQEKLVQKSECTVMDDSLTKAIELAYYFVLILCVLIGYYLLFRAAYRRQNDLKY